MSSSASSKPVWRDGYFTASDGTRLHYVDEGEGVPVILVHGARGSAVGNWFNNGLAVPLIESNRVIALDMRGHGLSGQGDRQRDRGRAPFDIIEFMQHEGLERAHIGGFSMGAGITMHLMMTRPDLFISAHLGGSGISETSEWRDRVPQDRDGLAPWEARAQELQRRKQEERGLEVGNHFGARAGRGRRRGGPGGFPGMWGPFLGPPPGVGIDWESLSEDEREEKRAEIIRLQEERLNALDLSAIDFPVMAVNGEYDRPYAKTHRLWREIRNFTNVIIPDHGHLSLVMTGTVPVQYIEALRQFIVSNNP